MIAMLEGNIEYRGEDHIVLSVAGVGYRVFLPLSNISTLPEDGRPVKLFIHTHVREDAINLFGFVSTTDRELFMHVTSISGIGPRLGMAIISSLPADDIIQAVQFRDAAMLTRVPGIGKKTAERIILELSDRFKKTPVVRSVSTAKSRAGSLMSDALSALQNLGFVKGQTDKILSSLILENPDIGLENLLKKTLIEMGRR